MDTQLFKNAGQDQIRTDIPQFEVGDTIAVQTIIRDKGKERLQTFEGIVIKIKGSGLSKTFTVRKVSDGIGVEKIFPINSTNIKKIEFVKKGKVRRSKIYYMRDRIGRLATKISEGKMSDAMKEQHESLNTPVEEKTETEEGEQPKEEVVVEAETKTEETEKKEESK